MEYRVKHYGAFLLTLMLVLWATAAPDATLKAAHALHVPGFFIQLMLLTYRHLFLLAELVCELRILARQQAVFGSSIHQDIRLAAALCCAERIQIFPLSA